MPNIGKLLSGYRVFKATTFLESKDIMNHGIKQGIIKPSTLIITTSGLQISPDKLLGCNAGDLFVIRNLGGLVPKYENKDSTIAAIEYAISNMDIENIIVLGHNYCHSVEEMMKDSPSNNVTDNENISSWLGMTKDARDLVVNELHDKETSEQEKIYEQEIIINCIKNLIEYPKVTEKMKKNNLKVFGWYLNILSGDLMILDPDTGYFEPVD